MFLLNYWTYFNETKTDIVYSNSVCTHYTPPRSEVYLCVVDFEAWHCTQPYILFLTVISGFSSFLCTIHCTPPCYILLFLYYCSIHWIASLYQTLRILFIWLSAILHWCTCQSWMISHLISSHLISSHLISSHLISLLYTIVPYRYGTSQQPYAKYKIFVVSYINNNGNRYNTNTWHLYTNESTGSKVVQEHTVISKFMC